MEEGKPSPCCQGSTVFTQSWSQSIKGGIQRDADDPQKFTAQGSPTKGGKQTVSAGAWGSPPLLCHLFASSLFCWPAAVEAFRLGSGKNLLAPFSALLPSLTTKSFAKTRKHCLPVCSSTSIFKPTSLSPSLPLISVFTHTVEILWNEWSLPSNNSALLIQAFQPCSQLNISLRTLYPLPQPPNISLGL